MKRRIGWDKILVDKIRDTYLMKFEWGITDCVKWSFNIVNSIVEEEVTPPVDWNNKVEALALLKERSLKDRMTDIFGEPKRMSQTMRGDFVYIEDPTGPTIGIAAGDKAAFISSNGGIVARNILDCECSWSID